MKEWPREPSRSFKKYSNSYKYPSAGKYRDEVWNRDKELGNKANEINDQITAHFTIAGPFIRPKYHAQTEWVDGEIKLGETYPSAYEKSGELYHLILAKLLKDQD